jgi:hypothetical protein
MLKSAILFQTTVYFLLLYNLNFHYRLHKSVDENIYTTLRPQKEVLCTMDKTSLMVSAFQPGELLSVSPERPAQSTCR